MGPAPLPQPHHGAVSGAPRSSATLCLLRPALDGLEVLMVRRAASARFMGGAWVFPGGTVDGTDRAAHRALVGAGGRMRPWQAAALRELIEETGVWLADPPFVARGGWRGAAVYEEAARRGVRLDPGQLVLFGNWVTPEALPVRFDARFFVAAGGDGLVPLPDGEEVDRAEFVAPGAVLARADAGQWELPFPTRKTLEDLARFATVPEVLASAVDRVVTPILPRVRLTGDRSLQVVLPGEPGYEDPADPAAAVILTARVTGVGPGAAEEAKRDAD